MAAAEIIQSILNGECDDNIEGLRTALKQREQTLAVMVTATLKPGDKVRVKHGTIRPRYLEGMIATVTRVTGGKVYATFDEPTPSGKYQGEIGLPQGTVDKVS